MARRRRPLSPEGRALGLGRRITRRDFLNGMALATGGVLLAPRDRLGLAAAEPGGTAVSYPPALTGLRGDHVGSFEVAHAVRDGTFWATAGAPVETGESYDLVVVGAGLSGLAAAHFFRKQAGPGARILVLDNHDDFGGHATRNEFRQAGRLVLGFGGTYAIDSAGPYSAVAKGLVSELGVDVSRWEASYDKTLYSGLGLKPGLFFDRETFGTDRLLPSPMADVDDEAGETGAPGGAAGEDRWPAFLAAAPLSAEARRDILKLFREKPDPLPGLSGLARKQKLARVSYADYLTGSLGLHQDVLPFLQARTHTLYGVGIDAVSAQDAWGLGLPGFAGMRLDRTAGPGMGLDAYPYSDKTPYFFHFPDGNATLARLLVRGLVPSAVPGRDAQDVVLSPVDYSRLDVAGAPTRIRLSSTVVRVKHLGDPRVAREVEVAYVRQGKLTSVRAARAVIACWHVVVPYICPELPEAQRAALSSAAKVPLVYTNVLLADWRAWHTLGVSQVHCPGSFHVSVNLDLPVAVGGYRSARTLDEPVVVHMVRTPCHPGLPAREQHRLGRMELYETSFDSFERRVRDQLARMLGPGGFDPARDIRAITVNRWPHGYAYQYNSLWDPFWLQRKGPLPCEVARQPFGRMAIANADAAAYSYTDAAFDQAWRAVQELSQTS